jgi:hypothetical protein
MFVKSKSSKAVLISQLESSKVYFEELFRKALAKSSLASTAATTTTQKAVKAISRLRELKKENSELKEVVKGLERVIINTQIIQLSWGLKQIRIRHPGGKICAAWYVGSLSIILQNISATSSRHDIC